jgi:hypothetical protein
MRGIAFSTPTNGEEPDFEALKPWVRRALDHVLATPSLELVNVNVPAEPRGMRWTNQSVRHYDGRVVPGKDPMGREHFWFTVVPIEDPEVGTDRWAMNEGARLPHPHPPGPHARGGAGSGDAAEPRRVAARRAPPAPAAPRGSVNADAPAH